MKKVISPSTEIELYKLPVSLNKLISELLDSNDFGKKHNARLSLVGMGSPIVTDMHKLLASQNGLLRMEAAKIIQLIADKRSINPLIVLLDDSDFDIRWIAAEGLIKIGRQSILPLLKAIRDGKSSFYLDKRAHQILNALLYDDEKQKLLSLMDSLDDLHELHETSPNEAFKALKIYKKFSSSNLGFVKFSPVKEIAAS